MDHDFMQKCDSCNFNSDEEKVKIHSIMKQRFTLYQLWQNHWTQRDTCIKKISMKVFHRVKFRENNERDRTDGKLLIQVVQFPVQKLAFHFQESPCEALGTTATRDWRPSCIDLYFCHIQLNELII